MSLLLDNITQLSHEFGGDEYIKAGGGNTSVKDAETLWVKPSGTTLAGLTPEQFVAMDRAKNAEIHAVEIPDDPHELEATVLAMKMDAVLPGSSGRPSVEAPLHDSFDAAYVVHTHPVLVNGMTCARDGGEACLRLFPEYLWVGKLDVGHMLCVRTREAIQEFTEHNGRQPEAVFLKNHGVFVAGDTPDSIRETYRVIMGRLDEEYNASGLTLDLEKGPAPDPAIGEEIARLIRETFETQDANFVATDGPYDVADGKLTPDHIVYMKPHIFEGEPTREALIEFRERYGYSPRVVATDIGVFGFGATENNAALALELAIDGAQVKKLTRAFGGIEYMDRATLEFIDSWEVEAYRRKVAEK
ncbi:MAG: class II aldolase/adducin family protein [Kiritimatiellia bacterium]|nr:class II aldolase/adducin family protein [Kiritimatiellia bacterium]